mmetsp:Transcript_21925/g.30525  ORF Transcript_21925/g.30525 Transcript_21925/m.30525 type:complete len:591 (-) Transcript_21925:211-1983(-)
MASCSAKPPSSNLETTLSISDIPASVIAYAICPYLSSSDLLSWRSTCSLMLSIITGGGDDEEHRKKSSSSANGTITYAEEIWKIALQRDFQINVDQYGYQTLKWKPRKQLLPPEAVSVFGYKAQDSIRTASSAFDSWKHWKKASLTFFLRDEDTFTNNDEKEIENNCGSLHLHAPYYLRAAKLWSKIESWMECTERSANVGKLIQRTLKTGVTTNVGKRIQRALKPDVAHQGLLDNKSGTFAGYQAIQAVYAFYGGQDMDIGRVDTNSALFGGYEAYNMLSCSFFISPELCLPRANNSLEDDAKIRIASTFPNNTKNFYVDCATGAVTVACVHLYPYPIVDRGLDSALIWFEEYATRLESGAIGVVPTRPLLAKSHSRHDPLHTIALYPQVTQNSRPSISNVNSIRIPVASRAVTKGVEVVASAVFTPDLIANNGIAYIYSIRIRLLSSTEEGYMSPAKRGFDYCQLATRHWRIQNDDTGEVDRVDGDGVIGMYPILVEGGYWENRNRFRGTFAYQSCSAPMKLGSFRGHLTFVPVTLTSRNYIYQSDNAQETEYKQESLTPPIVEQHHDLTFDVEVAPFILDSEPEFLY